MVGFETRLRHVNEIWLTGVTGKEFKLPTPIRDDEVAREIAHWAELGLKAEARPVQA